MDRERVREVTDGTIVLIFHTDGWLHQGTTQIVSEPLESLTFAVEQASNVFNTEDGRGKYRVVEVVWNGHVISAYYPIHKDIHAAICTCTECEKEATRRFFGAQGTNRDGR